MTSGFEKSQGIESLAHELFHGIQHEQGQGGASILMRLKHMYSESLLLKIKIFNKKYCTVIKISAERKSYLYRKLYEIKQTAKEITICNRSLVFYFTWFLL